jgi:hypothetical protein
MDPHKVLNTSAHLQRCVWICRQRRPAKNVSEVAAARRVGWGLLQSMVPALVRNRACSEVGATACMARHAKVNRVHGCVATSGWYCSSSSLSPRGSCVPGLLGPYPGDRRTAWGHAWECDMMCCATNPPTHSNTSARAHPRHEGSTGGNAIGM